MIFSKLFEKIDSTVSLLIGLIFKFLSGKSDLFEKVLLYTLSSLFTSNY
jgi:hypothetical protein